MHQTYIEVSKNKLKHISNPKHNIVYFPRLAVNYHGCFRKENIMVYLIAGITTTDQSISFVCVVAMSLTAVEFNGI